MPLQPITEQTFYLPGANNLGVIASDDGGAIAVDTGLDKDAARTLRKALDAAGLQLRAIFSTHHHADHIGGNAFLLRNIPDLQIYAPPLEAALIAHPILEPVYLNYGAAPLHALRTRWLMAQPAPVHHTVGDLDALLRGAPQAVTIAGIELELLPLPGHSPAQVGAVYDGVCFAADGFFGPAVLARHGVPYAHDIAAQVASLDRLATRREHWFLPGHGDLVAHADLAAVLDANQAAIAYARDLVLQALATPGDVTELTLRVLRLLGRAGDDSPGVPGIPQYVIFAGAVAAYLTYLEQQGLARAELTPQGVIWQHLAAGADLA